MARITHPQEIEVYYILPALRREISMALKAEGMEQKKIAGLLGVTEASISHYMHNKRAKSVKFDESMKNKIWESALRIKDVNGMIDETQQLLILILNEKVLCQACHEFSNRDVPEGCQTCFTAQTTKIAIPIAKQ